MISSLPAVPLRSDLPAAFILKADAFMAALPTFVNELNAMGSLLNLATTTTSTSSVLIGTGAKTFTVAAGLGYAIGMTLSVASTAGSANAMLGVVTGYSSTTLSINITSVTGSGTFAAWTISLAAGAGASLGNNTFSGVQNFAQSTDIASAATVNLTSATGNSINITGAVGITAFTLGNGMSRYVTFAGASLLTYNSATMKLNTGGANYTTVAGDSALIYALGGIVFVTIIRADGLPVVAVAQAFATGTRMSFNQSAAPTGWTQDTTAALNDSIIRIVTGTVGSGGATGLSAFNGQTATAAYTLGIADIPSHSHGLYSFTATKTGTSYPNVSSQVNNSVPTTFANTSAQGGNAAHSHGMTTNIKYNDFIIASKN